MPRGLGGTKVERQKKSNRLRLRKARPVVKQLTLVYHAAGSPDCDDARVGRSLAFCAAWIGCWANHSAGKERAGVQSSLGA